MHLNKKPSTIKKKKIKHINQTSTIMYIDRKGGWRGNKYLKMLGNFYFKKSDHPQKDAQ